VGENLDADGLRAALAKLPGWAIKEEIEVEDANLMYSFEIIGADKRLPKSKLTRAMARSSAPTSKAPGKNKPAGWCLHCRIFRMPLRLLVLAFLLTIRLAHAAVPTAGSNVPEAKSPQVVSNADETPVIKLEDINVSSKQEAFSNSIDRKTYNVGKDLESVAGSVSDLMQNIPSVQVDVDGNVRLRDSEDVLILIDGKTSTLMGKNRAAALEQMPADSIDRIEVITNPSAKYKPDGTAGIINIVRKRKHAPGYSGSLRATVGNGQRYNTGVSGNYEKGNANFSGSYSVKQDNRVRTSEETRSHVDPDTQQLVTTRQQVVERQRPLSHIGQLGVDYAIDANDKVSATGSYNHRAFTRRSTDVSESRDGDGLLTKDYTRLRLDPEYEQDLEFSSTYQHTFAEPGHELSFQLKRGLTSEQEDNRYTTLYRVPSKVPTFDTMLIKERDRNDQAIAEYVQPLANGGKVEGGYTFESENNDMDYLGTTLDSENGEFVRDPNVSNRFIYDSTIHSLYGTYGHPINQLSFLAGLRLEEATIDTNQVTAALTHRSDYFRLYPTLHLTYDLTDTQQLQLNYSRRVHRPQSEDLNPYPKYQDPFNLRAGNPALRPEDSDSIEAGYQYRHEDTSYVGTLYYRRRTSSITEVTRFIDAATLLTTKENLSTNQSGGLEVSASTALGAKLSVNASGNAYYNEIDASNLGFSDHRSTITWEGKLNLRYRYSKTTLYQLHSNYTAKRLTPQGERLPSSVVNLGVRHELKNKKLALIATLSDVFNSSKDETVQNTESLQRVTLRRRNSRGFHVGFIYSFGKAKKKTKNNSLDLEDKAEKDSDRSSGD
jgi:outer membrane receptor protein involved in Fe transport